MQNQIRLKDYEGKYSASQRIGIDVRLNRVDHYQSILPTQRHCGECRKNTKKKCKKWSSRSLKSGMELIDMKYMISTVAPKFLNGNKTFTF